MKRSKNVPRITAPITVYEVYEGLNDLRLIRRRFLGEMPVFRRAFIISETIFPTGLVNDIRTPYSIIHGFAYKLRAYARACISNRVAVLRFTRGFGLLTGYYFWSGSSPSDQYARGQHARDVVSSTSVHNKVYFFFLNRPRRMACAHKNVVVFIRIFIHRVCV